MAYSLHIEIQDEELELDEWLNAVSQIEGVKLAEQATTVIDPKTNQSISIASGEGDVSVLIGTEWVTCIYFLNGRATSNASFDVDDASHPVRMAASGLASVLGAQIVGDEGEVYEW